MYFMSRFFLITAQTREFPAILVMISTDVTTVTAISADSDITKRCQCCSHNLKGKMTCVFHKKTAVLATKAMKAAKTSLLKWNRVYSNFLKMSSEVHFFGVDFWGPHPNLERGKNYSWLFTSTKRWIRNFHVKVVQRGNENVPKTHTERAKLLYCFFGILAAVSVVRLL